MTRKQKYRQLLIVLIWFMIIFTGFFSYYYLRSQIPEKIHVVVGEKGSLSFSLPWGSTLETESEEVLLGNSSNIPKGAVRIDTKDSVTVQGMKTGRYAMDLKLFGVIPLRSIQVDVVEERLVYPGGESIGLYLETDGVMVVGTGELTDREGNTVEPAYGIMQSGDYILEVNGTETPDKETLIETISKSGGQACIFKIRRNGELLKVKVDTVKTEDGTLKAGIWVRDDAQGIGTLTYVEENGAFGALGHAMSDSDTGKRLETAGGALERASIQDVMKGEAGAPGSLLGTIIYGSGKLGIIEKNTETGVFGTLTDRTILEGEEPVLLGYRQDVELGPAVIRCCADGEMEEYEIEIIKADRTTDSNKGLVVQVTDEDLLALTGGIVQGMSGSPIIQDGKLVGAVTHVLVNDPTKGYGIFIENMLDAAG